MPHVAITLASPFCGQQWIRTITGGASNHCSTIGATYPFFAGEEWIEHSTLCLTGTRSATELLSHIVVPVGFEPTQPSLKVRCSTTELRNIILVDPERFERSHE